MAASGSRLPVLWYQSRLSPRVWPLLPLARLFGLLAAARRRLYRRGSLAVARPRVPVVVVGNLTVGGSGKTPLVLWLVRALIARGLHPGIVSRGYGGAQDSPLEVVADADPGRVGDEPLLLARRSGVPVVVCRDRAAAAAALLAAHPTCDLIVSDDGLQHYRLARDFEIAVFDSRGVGNGRLLPAGPLREPLARLAEVDAVVCNGDPGPAVLAAVGSVPRFPMRLDGVDFYALDDPSRRCKAADLVGARLHAIAGIGDPGRFFRQIEALGLTFAAHPFPDHHAYTAADLAFAGDGVLLMTEKDGVKCAGLAAGEAWVLPVDAELPAGLVELILEKIDGRKAAGHPRLPGVQGQS